MNRFASAVIAHVTAAHGGHHHALADENLWTWWTWDPLVISMLVGVTALYVRGTARMPGERRRWELASFAAGIVVVALALLSPIDRLSDILFSAHMTQHELLMLVGAPLIVLGRPLPSYLHALPPAPRARAMAVLKSPAVRASWRVLTAPVVALVLHGVVRWAWHIPVAFEAALRSEPVHAVQHAMFFATASLFWWALIHGRYGKTGYGAAVFFVFATAAHTGALGGLLTFAQHVAYPLYGERGAAWGVSAIEDQARAGLIMWVAAGTVLAVLGLALFAAWIGEARARAGQGVIAAARRAT